jgi:branched-chain amino acid transport system substrate-binding protein
MAACSDQPPRGLQGEVVLPFVNSLTGNLASVGSLVDLGSLVAIDEVNKGGGIGGKALRLQPLDDKSTKAGAADAAQQVVADPAARVIFGLPGSDPALGALELTVPRKVIVVSPANTSDAFTSYPHGGYYFRTVPRAGLMMPVLARYAHRQGHHKVGILANQQSLGQSNASAFAGSLKPLVCGADMQCDPVVARVDYPDKVESMPGYDFQGDLTRVFEPAPQAIFLSSYLGDGVKYLETWNLNRRWSGQWYAADPMYKPELITSLQDVAQGIRGATVGREDNEPFRTFKGKFMALHGVEPGLRTAEAYDALMIIALALVKTGGLTADADAIRDAMVQVATPPGMAVGPGDFARAARLLAEGQDINYDGAANRSDFDDKHDVKAPIGIWSVENRAFKIVEVLPEGF